MCSSGALPEWASEPCIMGIDEAGRGPVLGPMVYGCLYCPRSYQKTLASLNFADSKTLKEEKREELFENLKIDASIGWDVDIIDPRELSAKMLKKTKVNLNEISHGSAIGLVKKVLDSGFLLTEVYVDTVGDAEKYRIKLTEIFPGIKFVVAKKADSLFPVVSGASIVAKVTRDRALRDWVLDETADNMHRKFGSGYPGDPETKAWLDHHKHSVFGFPTLVRFSWGTCTPYFKKIVEVVCTSNQTVKVEIHLIDEIDHLSSIHIGSLMCRKQRSPIKWRMTAPTMGMGNANSNWLVLVSLDTKGKLKKLSQVVKVAASFSRLANLSLLLNFDSNLVVFVHPYCCLH